VLPNISIGIAILAWQISEAVHIVCALHVNCDGVRQRNVYWGPLGMPDCVGVAVKSVCGLITRLK
jgi:hypothetical protein